MGPDRPSAAMRWAEEGGPGELPGEARQQLTDILDDYDRQLADLHREPAP